MSMDIYSQPGTQIIYANPNNGWEDDQIIAQQYLVPDNIYTVDYTDVQSSKTYVYLVEVPGIGFNSVLFNNI